MVVSEGIIVIIRQCKQLMTQAAKAGRHSESGCARCQSARGPSRKRHLPLAFKGLSINNRSINWNFLK